ncbi:MAG: hypothetical protein K6F85_03935 [Bacteroidales bacterium]|nr:hypothetical protein [Bacteroidales bacterium]
MKFKLNFLKKRFCRPAAKGGKFDPQDWQATVKIVIAVLTVMMSMMGAELGRPDAGSEASEEPEKPPQPPENDSADEPFPAADFEPHDPPFDPGNITDLPFKP